MSANGKRKASDKADKAALVNGLDEISEDTLAELEESLRAQEQQHATGATGPGAPAHHAHGGRACFGDDFFLCCSPRKPKGSGGKRIRPAAPMAASAAAAAPTPPRPRPPPQPADETFGPMAVLRHLYPSLYS